GLLPQTERVEVSPAPPLIPGNHSPKAVLNALKEFARVRDSLYSRDRDWPPDNLLYEGIGKYREFKFVKVVYYPQSYNPVTKMLSEVLTPQIHIEYQLPDNWRPSQVSSRYLNIDQEKFSNPKSLPKFYQPVNNPDGFDYVILSSITDTTYLQEFVSWKRGLGYRVKILTVAWIYDNYSGADLGERIRFMLIQKFPTAQWDIRYFLMIGDYGTIPYRLCYMNPDCHSNDDNDNCRTFTDLYYAELSRDWDADGDGYYGEYGEDISDITPEISVGRIPFSYERMLLIQEILSRTIRYEMEEGIWKNNMLFAGAISNFANEISSDRDTLGSRTDGAILGELLDSQLPFDINLTKMYEKEGLDTSQYPSDYPLNSDNFTDRMRSGRYAMVTWSAHGSRTAASRKVWENDNLDGFPDNNRDEISWHDFSNVNHAVLYDDDYPQILFAASCNNGWPEEEWNLGSAFLSRCAAGAIVSSRVCWYTIGWSRYEDGGVISLDLLFWNNLIKGFNVVGPALDQAKVDYQDELLQVWGDQNAWKAFMNILDFNLLGDPGLHRIPNYRPEILTDSLPPATEDSQYSFQLNIEGPGAGEFSVECPNLPSWLELTATGMLIGIPREGDTSLTLQIIAADWEFSTLKPLFLKVIAVNDPPSITSPQQINRSIGDSINYLVLVEDPDNTPEEIRIIILNLPSWLEATDNRVLGVVPLQAVDTFFSIIAEDAELRDSIKVQINVTPRIFQLSEVYPNPFNATAEFRINLPQETEVAFTVYDRYGSVVFKRKSMTFSVGLHVLSWDGRTAYGKELPTGLYFFEIRAGKDRYFKAALKLK
ncbi:gliding motility-associated C-terminal domain-containing protein, partial [bacterium]|nr:gliding motility-associated C-terminal domain-containing protein [bacterium]